MQVAIEIQGLAEFTRALRGLDNDLPKGIRVALNAASAVVVDYGKARMARRSGRAASTIKARSTRTMVRVVEGGKRAPYVPWLDFGGATGRRKSVKRPFHTEGRYLYPALTDKRDEITQALENALRDVARSAGLELD
jgi:hypothetical protein